MLLKQLICGYDEVVAAYNVENQILNIMQLITILPTLHNVNDARLRFKPILIHINLYFNPYFSLVKRHHVVKIQQLICWDDTNYRDIIYNVEDQIKLFKINNL